VVKLRERLAELEGWPILTSVVGEASAGKQERLRAERARLEALPAGWGAQVEDLLTAQAASKLHADIVRQETRYLDSEWEEPVQALAARAKQLEDVLREVEALRGRRDTRLRDLSERRQLFEALLPNAALGERQRTRIEQDVDELQRQTDEQLGRLAAELHQQAEALGAATSVRAIQSVDLGRFPRSWLPAELLAQLQDLDAQRQMMEPVLRELETLGATPLQDLGQAHIVLQRLGELIAHPALSAGQQSHAEGLRQKILGALKSKRQEAESWLGQQHEHFGALRPEDGAGLARVQQALHTPPAFLDGQAVQKLQALQADVERRLEENEVLQIEALFSRITSPERRQACLERLRQLSGLTLA
jgi:hypothetical protein